MNNIPEDEIPYPVATLEETVYTPPSPLNVHVDVNQLFADYSEAEAWEILGKLKDLFS